MKLRTVACSAARDGQQGNQVVDVPVSEVAEHVMEVPRLVSAICATCEIRTALFVSVDVLGALGGGWWLEVGWLGRRYGCGRRRELEVNFCDTCTAL